MLDLPLQVCCKPPLSPPPGPSHLASLHHSQGTGQAVSSPWWVHGRLGGGGGGTSLLHTALSLLLKQLLVEQGSSPPGLLPTQPSEAKPEPHLSVLPATYLRVPAFSHHQRLDLKQSRALLQNTSI